MSNKVITRFPPSPTGPLHIGNVRTAIFNYLFAKQHGGDFIIRVEDTDRARSQKQYEENMLDHMNWLGLTRDNTEVWHQSERTEIYKEYLHALIQQGKAYISQETEGENKEVVRFKNPNKKVSFLDLIRGEVTVDTTDLGDFIIARNINEPVYHLAVVVDDFLAGVTHVIRGEDHISNTPRHILIQEAIGAPRPEYAHLPLILAGDRSKLSKRKHGESVSLDYYRKKGYLPEAILNYLALVGWNPGTEQELFTLDELIKQFDISKVQKGGAVFDEVKLAWINKEHIKRKDSSEVQQSIRHALVTWKPELIDNIHFNTPEYMEKVYPIILDHISVWGDVIQLGEKGSLSFFFETPLYDRSLLFWKDDTDAEKTTTRLSCVYDTLSSAPDQAFSSPEEIKTLIWNYAEQEGRGSVLWPLRVSLSGQQKSPDPFTLVSVLGKKESLKRIQNALDILKQQ